MCNVTLKSCHTNHVTRMNADIYVMVPCMNADVCIMIPNMNAHIHV